MFDITHSWSYKFLTNSFIHQHQFVWRIWDWTTQRKLYYLWCQSPSIQNMCMLIRDVWQHISWTRILTQLLLLTNLHIRWSMVSIGCSVHRWYPQTGIWLESHWHFLMKEYTNANNTIFKSDIFHWRQILKTETELTKTREQ